MINEEKVENKIGFDKIREKISSACNSSYAKERALSERVSDNEAIISKRLSLTDEMKTIYMFEQSFPRNGYIDTIYFLKPLETESSVISIENLNNLKSYLETLKDLTLFFNNDNTNNSKANRYPNLYKMSEPVNYTPDILNRINTIIDRHGEIRENASPQLLEICRNLREKENSVSRRVQSVLKKAKEDGIVDLDATVSVRDGKILIPVDARAKRVLSGYIYDESATGKTVYIEPAEVVELNNEIRELYFAKQREIARILAEFSDYLRPYIPELLIGAKFIGEIDFLLAKAKVSLDINAGKPIISKNGDLKLYKARHPLLEAALKRDGKEIVPLNLSLNRTKHILIISGPNAGGKSVCLKTTGLLQYMFQWGMLVSASETSELPIFKSIFIDIGDEQSIENDLSTYSSHLTNMKEIITSANKRSLVLIDEFGSGTEPTAGGAIAEAILHELDEGGVYCVITTHYTNLKYYAQGNAAGITNGAINGAMLFDIGKIMPLYSLEIGLPGNSFAFELARKIGLPERIIQVAREKAGSGFVDLEKQLRKISKNKRVIDEKLQRIKITDRTLEGITEQYQKELVDIRKNKKEIIEQAKREAKEIISEANKRIESTIKEIKEANAEREQTISIRRNLNNYKDSLDKEKRSEIDRKIDAKMQKLIERQKRKREKKGKASTNSTADEKPSTNGIAVGDKVRIKANGMVGEVQTVSKNNVGIIIGNINSKMNISDVEPISNNEYVSKLKSAGKVSFKASDLIGESISQRKLNFKPQIDIRGQRLDEALDSSIKFIDDALMVGASEVKILHGKGNGILKEEIRKFLLAMNGVAACRDEDVRYGGSGITVVTLE